MEVLRALLYGVSAQRPSHSLLIAGQQLPLEARMGGIFLGALCALVYLALLGRLRATAQPAPLVAAIGGLLVVLMVLDGVNAFLFDGHLPHLYAPNTLVRLATGLGAGFSVTLFALPVVAGVLRRGARDFDQPVLADMVELGGGLVLCAVIGGLLLTAPAPLLWPAAVLMLLAVLAAFGLANVYLLALAGAAPRSGLSGLLLSATGLALLEVVGLSVLRTWLATTFGLSWGV